MLKRKLGNTGLEVGSLVFGGNVFGWTVDEKMSFKLLDAFVDSGLNFIDTADVYSMWVPGNEGGESETIIGKWLQRSGKREQVIITTKVGIDINIKQMPGEVNLKKEYIMRSFEDSLTRLQTDYVDLYQAHRDDENTPFEESLEAFYQLIKDGKVRSIGASNYNASRLSDVLKVSRDKELPRFECLQPLYNLYDREEFEGDLQTLCVNENIGVIPYFSLGCGFLTGKYRTEEDLADRPRAYRVKEMMNERGFRILEGLDTVASELGATPAQVSLAWLMVQPGITAPIASATNLVQLDELINAASLELSEEAVKILNDASAC